MNENNLEKAIENFDFTIKKSVALESVHWRGRLRKAICLSELEQWDKAAFELKFFTRRKFKPEDSNFRRRPRALALYGKVLTVMEEYKDALEVLDEAIGLYSDEMKEMNLSEALLYRGLAKKAIGKKDFLVDIKSAADEGSEKAKELLAELGKQ